MHLYLDTCTRIRVLMHSYLLYEPNKVLELQRREVDGGGRHDRVNVVNHQVTLAVLTSPETSQSITRNIDDLHVVTLSLLEFPFKKKVCGVNIVTFFVCVFF